MEVNKALRRFREEFGLSQKDVADQLGILPQAYSRYETGKFQPKVNDLLKLAATYNVSTDYLLGLSNAPQPSRVDEVFFAKIEACSRELQQALQNEMDTRPQ